MQRDEVHFQPLSAETLSVRKHREEGPRGSEERGNWPLNPLVQETLKLTGHHEYSKAQTTQEQKGPSYCFIGVSSLKTCLFICLFLKMSISLLKRKACGISTSLGSLHQLVLLAHDAFGMPQCSQCGCCNNCRAWIRRFPTSGGPSLRSRENASKWP